MHSGYGITFHSTGLWSFDNDASRNAIVFGVDNSSYSHSDSNFLVLGGGPIFSTNGRFGLTEKKFRINFGKGNT